MDTILVLSHCLAPAHWYHPRKSSFTCLEPWFLQLLHRGHLQITWLWWPVGLGLVVPQDSIYLHTLESCCMKVWLPVSLNLGTDILPFGTLTGLEHPYLLGAIKNIIAAWTSTKVWGTIKSWGGLNDKVHLLHEITPSRQSEVVVSSTV